MKRLDRAAAVCKLARRLRDADSWCGEAHLQKAAVLLKDGRHVPLGYEFVLYKYGPFSFGLRDEVAHFRIRGLLEPEPQPYPYGPRIHVTPPGQAASRAFPRHTGPA